MPTEAMQQVLAEALANSSAANWTLERMGFSKPPTETSYCAGWNACLAYLAERTQTCAADSPEHLELLAYRQAVGEARLVERLLIEARVRRLVAEGARISPPDGPTPEPSDAARQA